MVTLLTIDETRHSPLSMRFLTPPEIETLVVPIVAWRDLNFELRITNSKKPTMELVFDSNFLTPDMHQWAEEIIENVKY